MKRRFLAVIALLLVSAMTLSSCAITDLFNQWFGKEVELTDAPLNAQKVVDFSEGAPDSNILFESDGWSNGDVFNVVWKKHNVHYENGIMRLGITEEKATAWLNDVEVEFDYTAGEARTQNYYHYGDYEVSMKPSANDGTASTFFICTGPYDVKDGQPNPHDEIDIEFLGGDTTKVQFNFFVNGKGGNEYMYDLGFDASEEFHTYGFRWEPDSITWFVDGAPVYKVTTDTSVKGAKNLRVVDVLPQTAGRMLANYWCGTENAWGWMGIYNGSQKDDGTQYQWIATSAEGVPLNGGGIVDPDPNPNPDDPNPDDPNPTEPTKLDVEFRSDHTEYTLEAPATFADSVRITYSGVVGNTWANVNTWLDGKIGGYDTLSFKIKNDGAAEVNIWLQLQNAGANIAEEHLIIPAGEEKEFEISYSGNVQIALFFIDSSHVVTEGATYAGDITISEIKVAKKGATEDPEPTPDPDPVLPEGEYLKFTANDIYTLHNEEEYVNSLRVTYTAAQNQTYLNVNAWIQDKAAGKTTLTLAVTNNGTETVAITTKLEKGTYPNAVELGVKKTEIAPGATEIITVEYTDSPEFLYFFIDTDWADPILTHAGDVTISNISFSGEATTPNPDPDPTPDSGKELQLNFWVSNPSVYTVNGHNIKYSGATSDYPCVGSADVASHAVGNNTFTVTITNNGTAESVVRIDLQAGTQVGNHKVVNTNAVGGNVWTDMEWGGSKVTVPAGESVTLVIKYNENTERGAVENLVVFVDACRGDGVHYDSDITLSGMYFSNVAE